MRERNVGVGIVAFEESTAQSNRRLQPTDARRRGEPPDGAQRRVSVEVGGLQAVLAAIGGDAVGSFAEERDLREVLKTNLGINDFDDACELPFTSDLVRLAASALLAAEAANVDVSTNQVCALLLKGYRAGLSCRGREVHDKWLVRQLAPDVAKIEMPENARDKRLALAPLSCS